MPRWLSPSHRAAAAGMLLYVCFATLHVARPPLGRDGWRESDVLIVARNFARHPYPPWAPHIDSQGPHAVPAGMEIPAINYVGGRLAAQGIDLHVATRGVAVACTLIAACSLFVWVHALRASAPHAAVATVAFLASPLVLRYGQAAQPDMPALAFALLALALLTRACNSATSSIRWGTYYASAASMALGMAMKLPVITLGLAAIFWLIQNLGYKAVRRVGLWGYLPVALGPPWAWYHHARAVQTAQNSVYFNITRAPGEILADISEAHFYGKWVGQLWDVQACPLVLLVALTSFYTWRRIPAAAWAMGAAAIAAALLAGNLGTHHLYYGLPATAAVCTLLGCLPHPLPSRRTLTVLVVAVAVWGLWRTRHWFAPPTLATEYLVARAALGQAPGPVQLISHNDPTLLYLVDRRGWADDRVRPLAAAHLIDLRRVRGEELENFQQRLRDTGHTTSHSGTLTQVWTHGVQAKLDPTSLK